MVFFAFFARFAFIVDVEAVVAENSRKRARP
jgi:hypothetical protein